MRISDWSSDVCSSDLPGDMMLILTEGSARVSMLTAGGREIVLAYAEPGAVLGEIALLDGGERTASVIATSAGSALQLGRNRSEEHTSELQSLMRNSYAVFCLKKKKPTNHNTYHMTYKQNR